jgi:hypothetical protein
MLPPTTQAQFHVRDHASWWRRPQRLKLVDASPADVERTWHCVSGCESDAGARPGRDPGLPPASADVSFLMLIAGSAGDAPV